MGSINIRKRIPISEKTIKICTSCNVAYDEDSNFCQTCGKKLQKKTTTVYANFGKNGITSISYKTNDGITLNTKGKITIPLGNGISYTTSTKK